MSPRRIAWLAALLLGTMASAHATEVVVYYHTDALHSTTVVTNAQGQVIERTHYAPYGAVLNRALRDGPGYAGHEEDAATGLVYMQQRYYDPESGTFLSADPVEANPGAGFNRYAYANDNPYRYTDPDGRCPKQEAPCPSPPKPKPQPQPKPKPKTLPVITVTAHAIPAEPGLPSDILVELPEIPFIPTVIGVLTDPVFIIGISIPGNIAPSDCGDGRCAMMSELGDKAPTDAPSGTLPLDKAKGKLGLSKDEIHKIKQRATGGLGGGTTWVGVAPNGEVGTSNNGRWDPQGTVDGLKH